MNFFGKFLQIDRRYIFIFVGIGVVLPLIFPIGLAVTTSPPVKNVYDYVEGLPPGTPILLSMDYDPSTEPELSPMALALMRHAFRRHLPVVVMTLHPGGPGLALEVSEKVAKEFGAKYGEDYVFLGYKAGSAAVMLSLGRDIAISYPMDYFNTPIEKLPLMGRVKTYNDLGMVVTISGSTFPDLWIAYAHERYGEKIAAGVTAVMAADYYPYLQTNQMVGLIGGLKGAAEYEALIGKPDNAVKGMDAQTIVHLFIVFVIILGNVAYLLSLRAKRRDDAKATSQA